MIGCTISHFKILEEIGAGGMGVVYKALDLRLQRHVAIKVLLPHLLNEAGQRERFAFEARSASALNHPNIVTVYEIDSVDGVDFIAMEYLEGQSLDRLLTPEGLALTKVLEFAIQIADALSRAHQSGIVHRDLKPQNIMVIAEDQIKILDFGLAKQVATPSVRLNSTAPTQERPASKTAQGTILGTLSYMSPEQVRGQQVDAGSDVFSFGVIFYLMLTGKLPFQGSTTADTLSAILRDPTPRLPTHMDDAMEAVSGELQRILEKCLAKEIAQRYQGMEELATDLRAIQQRPKASLVETAVRQARPSPSLCPGCQNKVAPEDEFCQDCGEKLKLLCPECGASNSFRHESCSQCGHALSSKRTRAARGEPSTSMKSYTPKHLVDQIFTS